MKRSQWTNVFLLLSPVLVLGLLLAPEAVHGQDTGAKPSKQADAKSPFIKQLERKGAYVDEEKRFAVIPPEGLHKLSSEQTKEIISASRRTADVPGLDETDDGDTINQTLFMATEYDPTRRRMVIYPGFQFIRSIDEFEALLTPDAGDFLTFTKQPIVSSGMLPGFLLDREFDSQGIRFRQICAYISDYPVKPNPDGFMVEFLAITSEFEKHAKAFQDSLNSFTVIPPEEPADMKEKRYTGKPFKEERPAWQSVEVIGSLVLVAVFIIWFLLRQLSAGSEEAAKGEEDQAGQPPSQEAGPGPGEQDSEWEGDSEDGDPKGREG